MGYDISGSVYTDVPVVDDVADLVDATDGLALSTLPGAGYGKIKRFKVRITADAVGEFNLSFKGLEGGVVPWSWVGFSAGDINSGQSFSAPTGGDSWIVESSSLALFSHLAAVVVIASGTPEVTVEIAGIGEE
jgi:hypothetical protein